MAQENNLSARISQQEEKTHHLFITGFLICLGVALFFVIYFVIIHHNTLGWAGVVIFGICALVFALGMSASSQGDLMRDLFEDIKRVVRERGSLTPAAACKSLDWPDAVIYEAIKYLVEEKELSRDGKGEVSLNPAPSSTFK